MAETKELAAPDAQLQPVASPTSTAIAAALTPEQHAAIAVDFESGNLPSIAKSEVMPVSLAVQYWSPENAGESKRCWVLDIGETELADIVTGELKLVECVYFVAEEPDGSKERFMSGSKKLVGMIKSAIQRGELIPKTKRGAVEITYKGLKQNKRNAFKSANWEIRPLLVA